MLNPCRLFIGPEFSHIFLAYINTNYITASAAKLVLLHITQWGKQRHAFGEMIHAAKLVKSYSNEHSTCRNATWIEVRYLDVVSSSNNSHSTCTQYEHNIDKNAHHQSHSEAITTETLYAQVLRFMGFPVPLNIPYRYPSDDDGPPPLPDSPNSDLQTLILAITCPAILVFVNPRLHLAWSQSMKTSVIAIDITSITRAVG